jgi:hypothetical protein
MFFALFPLLSFSDSIFWSGSPLNLNITVLLATICVICAGIYFVYTHRRRAYEKLERQRYVVRNYVGEFNPLEDTNPNRPLAISDTQDKTGQQSIAGNIHLLKRLRHITPEVAATIQADKWIDVFEVLTRP